jgi:hypothetical protein
VQQQIDMLRVVVLPGELDVKIEDEGDGGDLVVTRQFVVGRGIEIRLLREQGRIERGNCMRVWE